MQETTGASSVTPSDQNVEAEPSKNVHATPSKTGAAMEHVIPTRNQPALLGYYYAIFGLLPGLGLLLAFLAIAYGLIGLDRGNRLPRHIGYGHALFATVAGIIGAIISYGLVVAVAVMLMFNYMGSIWPFPPEKQPYEAPIEQLDQRLQILEQQAQPAPRNPQRNAF